MKSSVREWILCFVCASAAVAQSPYKTAAPGYRYEFPRDYFNHPDYRMEWWYYTGNLTADDGHRFGFELTFFRVGMSRDMARSNAWDVRDLYLAHLALSDLDGRDFYHTERINRAGPGIAGVDAEQKRIWNGNWSVSWRGENQLVEAVDERVCLSLTLHPEKPPVIQGENGVSQKGAGAGRASYYISLTRLKTSGRLQLDGKNYAVFGLSWMDHEFFTNQLDEEQVGWDWFSVQLSDNTELMLYRIRRADGSVDPYSSATYVDANGRAVHLRREDFSLTPGDETWKSPATDAVYPVRWHISVPRLNLELDATTALKSQELSGKSQLIPNYWEGAIHLDGHLGTKTMTGAGYLEMTGYDRAVKLGGR